MSETASNPPRNGEGDRAKRGGGAFRSFPHPTVSLARQLRKTMSPPEVLLWQRLRLRPEGLKFRRQHPIGPYVADFCCLSARLVVEVDGHSHGCAQQPHKDRTRDSFMSDNGYKVVRVAARDVLADADLVARQVVAHASTPLHRPADGPPPRAGEET